METFITERLSEESEHSIFDSIKRQKLATFKNLNKKQVTKTKSKTISLQTSKDLFSKVAIISQKRTVDLKRLFAFPLVHLPFSIAEPHSTLKKTAKSLLIHKLEEDTGTANVVRVDHSLLVRSKLMISLINSFLKNS